MAGRQRIQPEERLRTRQKSLGLSLGAIKRMMDENGGQIRHPLKVPYMRGELRLVIRCKSASCNKWAMSIVLYSDTFDGRIDCLDWEGSFTSPDGTECSGFHRHEWDRDNRNCENLKVPLPGFQPQDAEQFIREGLDMLGVVYEEDVVDDDGQMSLP